MISAETMFTNYLNFTDHLPCSYGSFFALVSFSVGIFCLIYCFPIRCVKIVTNPVGKVFPSAVQFLKMPPGRMKDKMQFRFEPFVYVKAFYHLLL